MTALRAGEVEIGFSNVASTIFGFDDGAKFVSIVGGAAQDATCPAHGIFVRANSAIQTVANLENTKIAVNTNHAIDEVMVPPLVVKYGAECFIRAKHSRYSRFTKVYRRLSESSITR